MGLAKELNEFFRGDEKKGEALDGFLYNEGAFSKDDPVGLELEGKFGKATQVSYKRIGSSFDTLQLVFSFANRPSELVGADGSYSSWEGTDWGGVEFYDVVESEKVVKVYKRVKS